MLLPHISGRNVRCSSLLSQSRVGTAQGVLRGMFRLDDLTNWAGGKGLSLVGSRGPRVRSMATVLKRGWRGFSQWEERFEEGGREKEWIRTKRDGEVKEEALCGLIRTRESLDHRSKKKGPSIRFLSWRPLTYLLYRTRFTILEP